MNDNLMMRKDHTSLLRFDHLKSSKSSLRPKDRQSELEVVSLKRYRYMEAFSSQSHIMDRLCARNNKLHLYLSKYVCQKRTHQLLRMTGGVGFDYFDSLQRFFSMIPQQISNKYVDIGNMAWCSYFGRIYSNKIIKRDKNAARMIAEYGYQNGDPICSLVIAMIGSNKISENISEILEYFPDKTSAYYHIACAVSILNSKYSLECYKNIFKNLRDLYRELSIFMSGFRNDNIFKENINQKIGLCMDASWVLARLTKKGIEYKIPDLYNACRIMNQFVVLPEYNSNSLIEIERMVEKIKNTKFPLINDSKLSLDDILEYRKLLIVYEQLRSDCLSTFEMTSHPSELRNLRIAFRKFEADFKQFQIKMNEQVYDYTMLIPWISNASVPLALPAQYVRKSIDEEKDKNIIIIETNGTFGLYKEKFDKTYNFLCNSDRTDNHSTKINGIVFTSDIFFVTYSCTEIKFWCIQINEEKYSIQNLLTIYVSDFFPDRLTSCLSISNERFVFLNEMRKLVSFKYEFVGRRIMVEKNYDIFDESLKIEKIYPIHGSGSKFRIKFQKSWSLKTGIVDFSKPKNEMFMNSS
jgi:hypothetical protein